MFASKGFRLASLFTVLVMALSMVSIDTAEARRGGSFGSRGTRTFNSAPATETSPNVTAPVQRSMTPAQQQTTTGPTAQTMQQRNNGFGGFGGSLMRGLMFGGLLGLLFGGGFGGFAGFFGLIFQVLIIGIIIALVMRAFARRQPQPAGAGYGGPVNYSGDDRSYSGNGRTAPLGGMGTTARPARGNPDELGIKPADLDRFEDMLAQVQAAYAREDYAALRALTTPEMMGYLSEELGENASKGVRNEVSDVKLLQGDVAESWREGTTEYATAAMRYSSVDVTRERGTGRVVDGDPTPGETTELWTFTRPRGGEWKLSAIQEA